MASEKAKILLTEKEESIVVHLHQLLTKTTYVVTPAPSTTEALLQLRDSESG